MILAIRTDAPTAHLYLLDVGGKLAAQHEYVADRNLANSLLGEIEKFISSRQLGLSQLTGVAYYSGAGSFTGLRIGASVANAMAYSLHIKVAKVPGETWLDDAVSALAKVQLGDYPAPDYDREANIT